MESSDLIFPLLFEEEWNLTGRKILVTKINENSNFEQVYEEIDKSSGDNLKS